ncbi:Iron-sulfur clusters incorporation protein [Arachnomyces sp. PD_36]|nr:Iron-sulfur clusters incorporation protein [Arachnomyces sp. PD_36]
MPPRLSSNHVCTQCLKRNRLFSTTRQQQTLPSHPPLAGYANLTNRALISISGADSTNFLQGLITQNILPNPKSKSKHTTPPKPSFYTAFLNAPGRVLNDVFIYTHPAADRDGSPDPGYLIEVDKAEVGNLMKHLKKHKLRSKLKLRALEDGERAIWASWDEGLQQEVGGGKRWTAYNLESEEGRGGVDSSTIGCVDTRAPGLGSRLLVKDGARLPEELPGKEVSLDTYNLRRILHGVPEGQGEIIHEAALPMESNMDVMGGIDYHKGCYLGQELTIRTHHTGVIRKRILPVQLYSIDGVLPPEVDTPVYSPQAGIVAPPAGANISRMAARKGRSAGKWLGGVGNVGLALCRLEMMTDIVLTGEGTQFSPEQEFKISWDAEAGSGGEAGEVKVKAFIPPWTREYITPSGTRNGQVGESTAGEGEGQRAKGMVEQLEDEVQRHNL